MVLDHGIEQGLRLYKEKIIRPRGCASVRCDGDLIKCEIQMLVMGW